jgi:TonB family protein
VPNTRVQRTRSSASPPHSPLTRRPLGAVGNRVAAVSIGISLCLLLGASSSRKGASIQEASARYEASHPGVLKVGGEVKPPKLIQRSNPDWEKIPVAKRKYRGPIIVEAVITAKGEVLAPQVLSEEQPNLDPLVLETVRQWKYEPATLKGKPVATFLTVTVTF